MIKNNNSKVIAVVALAVAVVGLGIGFAAFSSTLTISATANVTPSASSFNVDFSTSSTSVDVSTKVKPTVTGSATGTDATLSNTSNPTATGLAASFTEPGQTVTWSFYARNAGEYVAYLKSITFGTKSCAATSGGGATAALVTSACSSISLSVKVGSETAVTATKTFASTSPHTLNKATSEAIVITATYASGGNRADGPFTVTFGNVVLNYSSAA